MQVNWKRSVEGHVESKCGQFIISPLYWGCVAPQSYMLEIVSNGQRKCLGRMFDTQRSAKKRAEEWLDIKIKTFSQ